MTTKIAAPKDKVYEMPSALKERLKLRWKEALSKSLTESSVVTESAFPYEVRIGAPKIDRSSVAGADIGQAVTFFREWKTLSDTQNIQYKDISRRGGHKGATPQSIIFDDMTAMAAFLGQSYLKEAKKAYTRLNAWISIHPSLINMGRKHVIWMALTDIQFTGLTEFLTKRQTKPNNMMDIREMSLTGVDGKFLENNKALVMECLSVMSLLQEGTDWREQMGFRMDNRHALWVKFHPEDMTGPLGTQQFAVRSDAFTTLPTSVTQATIVENQATFFAYDPEPGCCLAWGSGNAISGMAPYMTALADVDIIYWGDIDQDGLKILDRVRAIWPHTQSVCMDMSFFLSLPDKIVNADPGTERIFENFLNLTQNENDLIKYIQENSIRVEQEHITLDGVHIKTLKISKTKHEIQK
jgi:hypothetical protein